MFVVIIRIFHIFRVPLSFLVFRVSAVARVLKYIGVLKLTLKTKGFDKLKPFYTGAFPTPVQCINPKRAAFKNTNSLRDYIVVFIP